MARTVNEADHAEKRDAILDAAQQLVYSKGYERVTINDIRAEVGISSGAFYHYFGTKPILLEALIERMQRRGELDLAAGFADATTPASEKLNHYFAVVDRLRVSERDTVGNLIRTWYDDDNAIVRQKIADTTVDRRAPLLAAVIRQGIEEGEFSTPFPEQAAVSILSLIHGMENAHARLLLDAIARTDDTPAIPIDETVEQILDFHTATMDAIERVLGASHAFLRRVDADRASGWLSLLQNRTHS